MDNNIQGALITREQALEGLGDKSTWPAYAAKVYAEFRKKPELERPHHDYSPSTLQSLEACPCYQSKQSDVPHPRTVIGTLSHNVTETGEDNAELSDEDADKVAECIDFFEQRKQSMEDAWERAVHDIFLASYSHMDPDSGYLLAQAEVPIVRELRETYLPIDDLPFVDVLQPPYGVPTAPRSVKATTAGYIDCALINHTGKYAEIFDWKFGMWAVEPAPNNLQGIAYALGMFKRYPELETVRFFFKQPNLDYITDATLTRADIDAHYLRIQVVVAKARAARQSGTFATATPMVPACNFCAHIASCPAVTKFACKVGSKFSPLDIPADITPMMVHNAADTKLGFQLAVVVEVWAGAFRQTVTNRVLSMQTTPPPGYKLVSRDGNRKIVDIVKYRNVALRRLTEEEYNSTLKPSLTALEKLISSKAPRGGKTEAVEKFAGELEEEGVVTRNDSVVFLQAAPQKPNDKNQTE